MAKFGRQLATCLRLGLLQLLPPQRIVAQAGSGASSITNAVTASSDGAPADKTPKKGNPPPLPLTAVVTAKTMATEMTTATVMTTATGEGDNDGNGDGGGDGDGDDNGDGEATATATAAVAVMATATATATATAMRTVTDDRRGRRRQARVKMMATSLMAAVTRTA